MKALLIRWVVGAIGLYATAFAAHLLHLTINLTGAPAALVAVAVLAIVNAFIRPLVVLLTLPLNCLTLGLFTFVINALMFWLTGNLGLGFVVHGFWAAIFGSIVMSIITGLANSLISQGE